jgi:peptidoglycan/LPS O-acetylase OafA/YrhL
MLLLFAVSGMAARFELDRRTEKEFIRVRTRKLLVPSTVGLLVFGWVLGYYNMMISGALDQMGAVPKPVLYLIMSVSGCGPLWYIQMLWLYSVVLIWIRKIEKDRFYSLCAGANVPVLLALTVLIYGSAQILNTPVIVVYRFGIYGLGFLIGYFVLSHDEVMDRVGKAWVLLTALALILCVVFVIKFWGQSYPDHEVLDTVICNIYAWTGVLGVLAFMKRWGNFENRFTRWMCRKSWGLYLFHYLMIAAAGWHLRRLNPAPAPVIVYMLTGAAGFAGSYLLYEIMSRIPVIRWCVLGIRKEK